MDGTADSNDGNIAIHYSYPLAPLPPPSPDASHPSVLLFQIAHMQLYTYSLLFQNPVQRKRAPAARRPQPSAIIHASALISHFTYFDGRRLTHFGHSGIVHHHGPWPMGHGPMDHVPHRPMPDAVASDASCLCPINGHRPSPIAHRPSANDQHGHAHHDQRAAGIQHTDTWRPQSTSTLDDDCLPAEAVFASSPRAHGLCSSPLLSF